MANFIDSEVNSYVDDISLSSLQTLIEDLEDNFDSAILNRFSVSSTQESTLSNTPAFFKTIITSALRDLYQIRSNDALASFEISGLDPNGTGAGLNGDKIVIEIGHLPNCTWYVKISLTKS